LFEDISICSGYGEILNLTSPNGNTDSAEYNNSIQSIRGKNQG
jgi:hypothetical protein